MDTFDVYYTLGVAMEPSAPTVIYEAPDCSVVLLTKDATPSLVVSAEVGSNLCRLVNAARQSARSLSHIPKAQPIEALCTHLEEILANFGRGLIEWQARLPLDPTAKLAAVELLSAVRELEEFQNNRGPSNT